MIWSTFLNFNLSRFLTVTTNITITVPYTTKTINICEKGSYIIVFTLLTNTLSSFVILLVEDMRTVCARLGRFMIIE